MKLRHDKTGAIGIGMIILLGAIFIAASGAVFWGVSQTQLGDSAEDQLQDYSVTGDCNVVPYITVAGIDAVNKGTAVTSYTLTYALWDNTLGAYVYKGTLTSGTSGAVFAPGDKVKVFAGKSDYIDQVIVVDNIKCGNNNIVVESYATDDPSMEVVTSANTIAGNCVTTSILHDGINQSSFTTAKKLELEITANADEGTGVMYLVIEADNKTEVDKFTVAGPGLQDTTIPKFFTQNATGSVVDAYILPALVDGESATYDVTITPESGATVSGTLVFFHLYSAQAAADVDGQYIEGIENSDGTNHYEDTQTYGVNIYSA